MKNIRTPRTLAECSFDTGYPLVPRRRPAVLDGLCWIAGVVLFIGLIVAAMVAA